MTAIRWSTAASAAAILLASAGTARAQSALGAPHAAFVYPAGGQQGTTFNVTVGGRTIDAVIGAVVSGRGIATTIVGVDKPLNPRQINDLREKAEALQKDANPASRAELRDIRMKIGDSLKRSRNTTIAEFITVGVTIAADADPGPRQLRLLTPLGLTNPIVFVVGQLPEFGEPLTPPPPEWPRGFAGQAGPAVLAVRPESVPEVTLPVTLNGRIVPGEPDQSLIPRQPGQYEAGDVDRYRFQARAGQQLVFAASARDLMPYLPDAVPGWFQATLTLYDSSGREVAYSDDYRFQPDPVIAHRVQADGEYVLEVKDAIFRGREDFVYRIAAGELPFVTGIFPLGGQAGSRTTVEVSGWNLPVNRLTTDTRDAQPGIYPVSVRSGQVVSNRVPFAVDTLTETLARGPDNSAKEAQKVTLPLIVNGRIESPGDWDTFSFSGRAGEVVVAEAIARRVASPLDSVIELTDASGRRIAFNDDAEDRGAGLVTHQADSIVTATLPAAGTYFVRVGDRQHKGGPEHAYRLRLSGPRPDFELRVAPAQINVGAGGTVPFTVVAVRKDGFDADIALTLKDEPAFVLSGAVLPAGQDRVRLTLTAPPPPAPPQEPFVLAVEGQATILGKTVTRRAVPAEEMMQAFAYKHLVPSDALRVLVTNRGSTRVPMKVLGGVPIRLAAGRPGRVRVAMPPGLTLFENLQLELSEPPEGVTLGEIVLRPNGAEFDVVADAAKTKAGLRGNLIVAITGERVPPPDQQGKVARRRVPLGTLPAMAFEIVRVP